MMSRIEIIPVGPLETNCYVVSDPMSCQALVIDPGFKSERLLNYIRENNYHVSHILITHGHFDHVGGVTWFVESLCKEGYEPPTVMMSFAEKKHMESKSASKYQKYFFDAQKDIVDGEDIDFGFIQFKSLILPGHTNFSMCFYSEEEGIVFVGDTLFYHSIGTETYYDGPADDLTKNIVKTLFALPEQTIVYPGHRQSTTIKEEMTLNPYLSDADTVDPWLI